MVVASTLERELPSFCGAGSLLGTGVGDPAREGCAEPYGVGTDEAIEESEGGRDRLERGLGTGDRSSRVRSYELRILIYKEVVRGEMRLNT